MEVTQLGSFQNGLSGWKMKNEPDRAQDGRQEEWFQAMHAAVTGPKKTTEPPIQGLQIKRPQVRREYNTEWIFFL